MPSFMPRKIGEKTLSLAFLLLLGAQGLRAGDFSFVVRGEVQRPGVWQLSELKKFPVIPVRLREFSPEGKYRGLCAYRVVPFALLLERVGIEKSPQNAFRHKIDMAIFLANRSGQKLVLSWGEIFYQSNPTHYLLAIAKKVIKPTAHPAVAPGSCTTCHTRKRVYRGRLLPRVLPDALTGVKFLVVRSGQIVGELRNLASVEIRSVRRKIPATTTRNHVFSPEVLVVSPEKTEKLAEILETGNIKITTFRLPEIGSGCGYHGTFTFQGYPVKALFARELSNPDFWGLFVSAPDGYRTFVSRNEMVGALGKPAILAFLKDGHPLESPEGKFMLVLPNDLFFDRWIRAVNRIEILVYSR